MKIIIVGASGTLGKKITAAFEGEHEIIRAGSKSGDINVNITSAASIESLFKQAGPFDALISAAGGGYFGPVPSMTPAQFEQGLRDKLLGQVSLVLIGQHYINPRGSFTLTSGILADDPIINGAALSAVNGALNSFVMAAAIELENGVRVNAISPGVVEDSRDLHDAFPGHIPVTMERVINGFRKSVLGRVTGQVIKIY